MDTLAACSRMEFGHEEECLELFEFIIPAPLQIS